MSPFVPGLELSRRLYDRAVDPILTSAFPGLRWAAACIGPGSDVLGYDTARSMDHDWGPRLHVFVAHESLPDIRMAMDAVLRRDLPLEIDGFPTRVDYHDDGTTRPTDSSSSDLDHRIQVTSVEEFFRIPIGCADLLELSAAEWLTAPEQMLLERTAGEVFRDPAGELSAIRTALAWYPDDIWRYRRAAAWMRIGQVEPFVGRAGEVGDDLGSEVIGVGLVRDVMRLHLLQSRQYAPYPKWLGTAFTRSPGAEAIRPHLHAARFARSWRAREAGLTAAIGILARRHNLLGLTTEIDPTSRPFHTRPFTVIDGERFANALLDSVTDPDVGSLPPYLGGFDQYCDSTDALGNQELRAAIRNWLDSVSD